METVCRIFRVGFFSGFSAFHTSYVKLISVLVFNLLYLFDEGLPL